ncbi:MAG: hypothetical protein JSS30_05920 [Verrucomicrobia bacterium]|nr:hypothetical protein [Verrucomicrobiota bacterium]
MKIRKKVKVFLFAATLIFGYELDAREGHEESPHYEWIEGKDVAVLDDGIYIDTVKGMMRLNVVDYDRVNDRYQILCTCLERPGLLPFEALSVPFQEKVE